MTHCMIWSTTPHNPHSGWEFPAHRPKIWEKHRTQVNNNNRIHAKWLAYDNLSAFFLLLYINRTCHLFSSVASESHGAVDIEVYVGA